MSRKKIELTDREKALAQAPVSRITIDVVWKKSRLWGHNPHASVSVLFHDGYGSVHHSPRMYTCSGCGYDKESTVIADIFNDYLKYKLYRRVKRPVPYGIRLDKDSRYFCGGVGTDCYYQISRAIAGKFQHTASTSCTDTFTYIDHSRKDRKAVQ